MVEYHRVLGRVAHLEDRLIGAVGTFSTFIENLFPEGPRHWATYVYDEEEKDLCMRKAEKDLMLKATPFEMAKRAAVKVEEESLFEENTLEHLSMWKRTLKTQENRVLDWREKYLVAVAEKDDIRRWGDRGWFEAVVRAREKAEGEKTVPLLQVNRLQAAVQQGLDRDLGKEMVENGIEEEATEKDGASSSRSARPMDRNAEEHGHGAGHRSTNEKMEDATWALFLVIASGDAYLRQAVTLTGKYQDMDWLLGVGQVLEN